MAQFDIYRIPSRGGAEFLLDLQDDLVGNLATRVVAPLVRAEQVRLPMQTLNPRIWVSGQPYLLLTNLLAAIPVTALGEVAGTAKSQRNEIIASIDLLFAGIKSFNAERESS